VNYREHAMQEYRAAGWVDENGKWKDEMQELICNQVMELLDLFGTHGHSGTTAPYARTMFDKLSSYEPIAPLTGEDWEWIEVGKGVYQNKRCGHVFKENGQAYDSEGIIFKDKDGYFQSKGSRVNINFPYTPKQEVRPRP